MDGFAAVNSRRSRTAAANKRLGSVYSEAPNGETTVQARLRFDENAYPRACRFRSSGAVVRCILSTDCDKLCDGAMRTLPPFEQRALSIMASQKWTAWDALTR
jgi:hypothetical protein